MDDFTQHKDASVIPECGRCAAGVRIGRDALGAGSKQVPQNMAVLPGSMMAVPGVSLEDDGVIDHAGSH